VLLEKRVARAPEEAVTIAAPSPEDAVALLQPDELDYGGAGPAEVRFVLALLRRFPHAPRVAAACCNALASLCVGTGSRRRRAALVAGRGCDAVAAAMGRHGGDAALQRWAAQLFWILADDGRKDNRLAVWNAGGVDAVRAALKRHAGAPAVQRFGRGALAQLGAEASTPAKKKKRSPRRASAL